MEAREFCRVKASELIAEIEARAPEGFPTLP
jgi:hypothetical protein